MPKPTIATRSVVFAAADALLSQGKKPTIIDIRRAIGGGSESTIGNELRNWRVARDESVRSVESDVASEITPTESQALQNRVLELEARIEELRWVIINGSPMRTTGLRSSRLEELAAQIAEGDRQWSYLKEHAPYLADDPVQLQREQTVQRMCSLLADLNQKVADATPKCGTAAPVSAQPAKWGMR
jgi:hypothetical protein